MFWAPVISVPWNTLSKVTALAAVPAAKAVSTLTSETSRWLPRRVPAVPLALVPTW
ncbi:hypothetical protein D3C81_1175610 [compost metagenome]